MPEQISADISQNFSNFIESYLKRKGISRKQFIQRCNLSKAMASRILRNTNSRNSGFTPSPLTILAIGVGLKMSKKDIWSAFYAAYPEWSLLEKILSENMDIDDANSLFYDLGLNLLGNVGKGNESSE